MLAVYKQMFYGLLQFTHMIGVTVSNFGLQNFVTRVQAVMIYFKLKQKALFLVNLNGITYNASIV